MWEILPLFVEYAQRKLQTFQRNVMSSRTTEHSGWERIWAVRTEGSLIPHRAWGGPPDPPVLKSTGVADNSQGTQSSLGSDEEDIELWSWHLQYMDCEHQQWRLEGQSRLGSMPTKGAGTEDDEDQGPHSYQMSRWYTCFTLLFWISHLQKRRGERRRKSNPVLSENYSKENEFWTTKMQFSLAVEVGLG